jgi:hypothetical protein
MEVRWDGIDLHPDWPLMQPTGQGLALRLGWGLGILGKGAFVQSSVHGGPRLYWHIGDKRVETVPRSHFLQNTNGFQGFGRFNQNPWKTAIRLLIVRPVRVAWQSIPGDRLLRISTMRWQVRIKRE